MIAFLKKFYPEFHAGRLGLALLLVRLIMGAAFIFHGYPKIIDIRAFAGTELPIFLAGAAAVSEFAGGILLVLGLLTPVANGALFITMLVAIVKVHWGHPFVSTGGPSWELAGVYLTLNLALLFSGPGRYSADASLMKRGW